MKSEGEGWEITNDAQIDWNYFERVVLTDRMCCKCTVILTDRIDTEVEESRALSCWCKRKIGVHIDFDDMKDK